MRVPMESAWNRPRVCCDVALSATNGPEANLCDSSYDLEPGNGSACAHHDGNGIGMVAVETTREAGAEAFAIPFRAAQGPSLRPVHRARLENFADSRRAAH